MNNKTQYDPGAGRAAAGGMADSLFKNSPAARDMQEAMGRVKALGMSPRQLELNRRWAYYTATQYDNRRLNWNGRERADPIEHEAIASAGFLPPGYYDAGESMPIEFRRPTVAYHLVRVIVNRFTSLLFSESQSPRLHVDGDQDTEDFVSAMIESAGLWPAMIMARTHGGATGTSCIGFQFIAGKPVVEVHDPRWIIPVFEDRATWRLKSIEIKYQYPVEMMDRETGEWDEVMHWYRRIIDDESDTLFRSVPVGDGTAPMFWPEERAVAHGLGFCPVVWIQNIPVQDDADGEPDVWGIYELVEGIDAQLSQCHKGTLANADPTLLIKTASELGSLRKGSENAIKLPGQGDDARYMEIGGAGLKMALDLAGQLRSYALEVAQCVLDHPDTASRTATEIERVYSSMLSKADIMREQYGQRGVRVLVEMMIAAARKLSVPRAEAGGIVRGEIKLPLKIVKHDDGTIEQVPHRLGNGGTVQLKWGPYFAPSVADAQAAASAAGAAKGAGILGDEEAAKYIAPFFKVEDATAMVARIREQAAAQESVLLASMGGGGFGGSPALPEE